MASASGRTPILPSMIIRRFLPMVIFGIFVVLAVWNLSPSAPSEGFTNIYFFDRLSFQPHNTGDDPSYQEPGPPPPPGAENWPDHVFNEVYEGAAGMKVGEDMCEPYAMPGHLYINQTSYGDTYFESFTPLCQPAQNSWIKRILLKEPIPELQNKEFLTVGDSVDRYLVMDLCTLLDAPLKVHPLHSFTETTEDQNGGLPRSCYVEHLNLTMANWFFYGYDEEDMWTDKSNTYTPPGEYHSRWDLFSKAIKTLPSNGHPSLIITNQGLWELARYDRLLERAGSDDPDPPIVSNEFITTYMDQTLNFLSQLRTLVGDSTRIRWRQMHTPTISSGPFFKTKDGETKKSRARFHPVKIRQMNEVAKEVIRRASVAENDRRKKGGVEVRGESGRITMWPIGDIISWWPTGLWLRDDIHPTPSLGAFIWGEGALEYLARTPRR
ncbi:hypothetical protein RUND412_000524 [Rhizina undulata]